jgi:putative ABC transport system substrate-binding protein
VAVEYRYAENQLDRLPALAADLVRRRVAVIVVPSAGTALAAKAATATIPIVFSTGGDPVALGLVASLNRPGGNHTGIVNLYSELGPKQLQLLRELIPDAALFGVLRNPEPDRRLSRFPSLRDIQSQNVADLQAAARALGLQLVIVNAIADSDLEPAFATLSQQHVGAVLVNATSFVIRHAEQIAALAARHALPAIFPSRELAMAGGLMSYGSSLGYGYHQVGIYTGRILKGESQCACEWDGWGRLSDERLCS